MVGSPTQTGFSGASCAHHLPEDPAGSCALPEGVPEISCGSLLRAPRRGAGTLVVGAHKELGIGARAESPGSSLLGPRRSSGELVVGPHKEPGGACLREPRRGPGELVVGAHQELGRALCRRPQGAPGS
eukprot:6871315-Pyramimonas_sp.AAC.1